LLAVAVALVVLVTEARGAGPDEPTVTLEPVVITGTAIPDDATPAHVTIVPGEMVEAAATVSATEALRQVPGVHLDESGSGVSSLYLRGAEPNFSVVLLDGVRVNDPTNSRGGSFDFATLTLGEIERIEVVRGPLSSVYGSDALAGAVQVLTRRGRPEPESRIDLGAGRWGWRHGLAATRGAAGRFDYAVTGSYLDDGEPIEGSERVVRTGHANWGVVLPNRAELRSVVHASAARIEAFPDDSGGPEFAVLDATERREADDLAAGLTLTQPLPGAWEARLHATYYGRTEAVDSPGVAPGLRDPFGIPPNRADTRYRRRDLAASLQSPPERPLRLSAGLQAQREAGESDGALDLGGFTLPTDFALTRDQWGAFAEARLAPADWPQLAAAVRYDRFAGFDAELSPSFGASYTVPIIGARLRAQVGRGFKLPSFFALSHPVVGNPGLAPETGRTAEAGVEQPLGGGRVTIGVTAFASRYRDLVDFDEGPPPRMVNRDAVTVRGFEAELALRPFPAVELVTHATYTKTNIVGTDEPLRNRPKWRGGATLLWRPAAAVDLYFDLLYVGQVFDSSIPTGDVTLDRYTRADLAVTWRPLPLGELFVAVDNLFDTEYEEAVGFAAPGRRPRAGLRASW
jgi:outer membrane cobalamin receptor